MNELRLVQNLKMAANHHKIYCDEKDCGVSLGFLRETAIILYNLAIAKGNNDEAKMIKIVIDSCNWY